MSRQIAVCPLCETEDGGLVLRGLGKQVSPTRLEELAMALGVSWGDWYALLETAKKHRTALAEIADMYPDGPAAIGVAEAALKSKT